MYNLDSETLGLEDPSSAVPRMDSEGSSGSHGTSQMQVQHLASRVDHIVETIPPEFDLLVSLVDSLLDRATLPEMEQALQGNKYLVHAMRSALLSLGPCDAESQ